MTLHGAVRAAIARLERAGVDGAANDARILLAYALGITRQDLVLLPPDTDLAADQMARFEAGLRAREARQPISQIIGTRLFWGRSFRVTSDVLDPRPETETLIAAALEAPFSNVLDLGTGTGCILLTLLAERADSHGLGVDLSAAAIEVARANCREFRLDARCAFVAGNWYAPIAGRFDLIVANPPYIAEDEMAGLAPEVRDWEPHMALTPGGDGLAPYRAIAAGAPRTLIPGGRLLVEIGASQGAAVARIFAQAGLSEICVLPDLDRRDRVVRAVWRGEINFS